MNQEQNQTLSEEQQKVFELYKQRKNVFVTGPGGTGKSYLIKKIVEDAKKNNINYQVCALTGCAAVLLNCNAKTIHSWAGIGIASAPINKVIDRVYSDKKKHYNWKKTKLLIVDEVSMMSSKILKILDLLGRKICNPLFPFGNIQLLFFGDFYQLSPVGSKDDIDSMKYAFEYEHWYTLFPKSQTIQLTNIFRQNDKQYIKILNQIRIGKLTKSCYEILTKRVNIDLEIPYNFTPTKLFPTRNAVDTINNKHMNDLIDNEEHVYDAVKEPQLELLTMSMTDTKLQLYKQEQEYLLSNSLCENKLKLKVGAQVMCIANIDMEKSTNPICNGSQGIIKDIIDGKPLVQFTNGRTMLMEKHSWKSEKFESVCIKQYPLILAWAITIHKSQGATLDYAEVDAGSGIFACGQTYVALSRVKSIEGLSLKEFNPNKIKVDQSVIKFYSELS